MKQVNAENCLRKAHSLSGLLPLGIFLCVHMILNYSATSGVESYNTTASFMANLPFKEFLETFVIFVPLCFHAFFGIYIALQAKHNVIRYRYVRNWSFFLQRITGFIAFAFVVWHVWDTRVQVAFGAEPNYAMMATIVAEPLFLVFYIVGVLSVIYHFLNGLWGLLITWGITVAPKSQRLSQYLLALVFVGFSVLGIQAILAFTF